jgi:hypothetical protein
MISVQIVALATKVNILLRNSIEKSALRAITKVEGAIVSGSGLFV